MPGFQNSLLVLRRRLKRSGSRFRMSNKGIIFVISSPSGGGKTSVVRRIINRVKGLHYIVSATTRSVRSGEKPEVDYIYLSDQEFEEWMAMGKFVETTVYNGHRYGTPKESLINSIDQGRDVILDIDVRGGEQVKKLFPESVLIFLLPPSREELRKRLERRGRESNEEIEARLKEVEREIDSLDNYDYVVINDDLEKATDE
ncbi:MAG TPA: guanylate kinase, partial [bacterium (Candidatus Stahlbacteria)]|nr:guanylate kinase [Candidatus Stahlbacteria bacterium]